MVSMDVDATRVLSNKERGVPEEARHGFANRFGLYFHSKINFSRAVARTIRGKDETRDGIVVG